MARQDQIDWLAARSEAAQAHKEVELVDAMAGVPTIYIPESVGDRAAVPAAFLWGALFAVLQRDHQKRPTLRGECLAQAGKLSLHFWGVRLGQDDLDLFLVLVSLARGQKFGEKIIVPGAAIPTALGLKDSGGKAHIHGGAGARDRIEESLRRLSGALVELRGDGGAIIMGHLVDSARRGRGQGANWVVRLAPELGGAFSAGTAGVDLRVRRALRGKPLAGWVHAWLSSHGGTPYPTTLDNLRRLAGCTCEPKAFPRQLTRALEALEKAIEQTGKTLHWTISRGQLSASDRGPVLNAPRRSPERRDGHQA